MTIPTFDLNLAPPGTMLAPSIVGAAIEGGRSLSGITNAGNIAGGGLVTIKYGNVQLRYRNGAPLRYWSQLGAILNGGIRSILVPFLIDKWAPVLDGFQTPIRTHFSDGTPFANGAARFAQASGSTVSSLIADGAIGAGTVTMLLGSRALTGGEWFEIAHPAPTMSRAYCVTEVDSATDNGDGTMTFVVGIRPTLRAFVPAGTSPIFDRPKCLMRLAPGTVISAEVSSLWKATPDVTFIESFGST